MSEQATVTTKKQRWFPLESNPTLINKYISQLGFSTDLYEFVDVFSTEDWALDMISQPVAAVLFLYPLTEKQTSTSDDTILQQDGKQSVWFIKQRIGNACGTIGLLHSLLNTPEPVMAVSLQPDSWLGRFHAACPAPLDPLKKATYLESNEEITRLHDDATSSTDNQTSRGSIEDRVETHFIALVHKDGLLLEMDGRKEGPVSHGATTPGTLLQDACKVIQTFMKRDPEEVRFTILALAPK